MGIIMLGGRAVMLGGQALSISTTITYKAIDFCDISTTCPNYDSIYECTCGCLRSVAAMSAGECYGVCIGYNIYKAASDTPYEEYVAIICNSTTIRCCSIIEQTTASANGIFTAFNVCHGDDVHVVTFAEIDVPDNGGAYSCATVSTLTPLSGNFCYGTNQYQRSITCAY
jgi:hypothetical protein